MPIWGPRFGRNVTAGTPRSLFHLIGQKKSSDAVKKLNRAQVLRTVGKPALANYVERSAKRDMAKAFISHSIDAHPMVKAAIRTKPAVIRTLFR
jgi:hypothetical protein